MHFLFGFYAFPGHFNKGLPHGPKDRRMEGAVAPAPTETAWNETRVLGERKRNIQRRSIPFRNLGKNVIF